MQAVEPRERAEAGGARRHVRVPLVHPVLLLRGIVTLRLGGPGGWEPGSCAQASPVSRRPAVYAGWGRGWCPADLPLEMEPPGMLREQVPDLHPGGMSRGAAALRDGGE